MFIAHYYCLLNYPICIGCAPQFKQNTVGQQSRIIVSYSENDVNSADWCDPDGAVPAAECRAVRDPASDGPDLWAFPAYERWRAVFRSPRPRARPMTPNK